MPLPNPSWEEYYMNLAKGVASRATCLRRRYGAIIVKDNVLVSTGYCGAPRGTPNCTDLGKCFRQEKKVPSGERYELCRSCHAEMNGVINAAREGCSPIKGAVMYVYGFDANTGDTVLGSPCKLCKRVVINAGIKEVVYSTPEKTERIMVSDWIEEANQDPFGDLI